MYIFEFVHSLVFIFCHVYSKVNGMLKGVTHIKIERKVFCKEKGEGCSH